jgi:hypothetical protein
MMQTMDFEQLRTRVLADLEIWRANRTQWITPPDIRENIERLARLCPADEAALTARQVRYSRARFEKMRKSPAAAVDASHSKVQDVKISLSTNSNENALELPSIKPNLQTEQQCSQPQLSEKKSEAKPTIFARKTHLIPGSESAASTENSRQRITFTEYVPIIDKEDHGTRPDDGFPNLRAGSANPVLELLYPHDVILRVYLLSPPVIELLRETLLTRGYRKEQI